MENKKEFKPISRELDVILTDDDNTDRLLFKDALDELPVTANLITVTNGEELIQWLTKKENKLPDVIFLDLQMPRKNGFATLGEIKRNPHLEDLPIFIFSTANEEVMIKQVYKDAAHYFIRKPESFESIKSLLYKALKLIAEKDLTLPTKENFLLTVNE